MRQAEMGIAEMRKHVDTMIVVPERAPARGGRQGDAVPGRPEEGGRGAAERHAGHLSNLISVTGIVNVDFADVRTVMQNGGSALMGTGIGRARTGRWKRRSRPSLSPLLDNISISGATGVLINITGGADLTLGEVTQISEIIHDAVG